MIVLTYNNCKGTKSGVKHCFSIPSVIKNNNLFLSFCLLLITIISKLQYIQMFISQFLLFPEFFSVSQEQLLGFQAKKLSGGSVATKAVLQNPDSLKMTNISRLFDDPFVATLRNMEYIHRCVLYLSIRRTCGTSLPV